MAAISLYVFLFTPIFIAVALVVGWLFTLRCPACKRLGAYYKTAAERAAIRQQSGRFIGTTYQAWLCKHCGYWDWRVLHRHRFSACP